MVIIRRLARGLAIVAVAMAAGHLVQTINTEEQSQAARADQPTQVEQVSSGPEAVSPQIAQMEPAALTNTVPQATPVAPLPTVATALPALALPAAPAAEPPMAMLAAVTPDVPLPAPVAPLILPTAPAATATPPILPAPPAPPAEADACPVTLDVMPEAQAMLGLTLLAPCHADERVVLRHAGLAVTARTNATGSLFVSLPAMAEAAEVSVLFADQTTVAAAVDMPELATMRRFAVQWMAEDAFQLQALENGADYGSAGHRSAENPGNGSMRLLGDATVDLPMLAQVYTYPSAPGDRAEVIVEVAVTGATCNRDLLGETIASVGGAATVTELTVATPPCDAVGDILVLKNLAPDLKIAAN